MLTAEISPQVRTEQITNRMSGRDLPSRALAFVAAAAGASGRAEGLSRALEIADVLLQIEADDEALAAALIVCTLPRGEIDAALISDAFGEEVTSLE